MTVDLSRPLPAEFVGKAGFNMELFPTAFFGKAYHLGGTDGVFTRQGNGPVVLDEQGARPAILAEGPRFVAAPEDPMRRLVIESLNGDIQFYDGRSQNTHNWFLVRSLIPAGAAKGAVRWRITPNAVPGWTRPPVIGISQVGYHPGQDKRAVIELDPRADAPGEATLLRLDSRKGPCSRAHETRDPMGSVPPVRIRPLRLLGGQGARRIRGPLRRRPHVALPYLADGLSP